MAAQEIHREEHNGIPVMWSDIRSTFSGALTFAIGVQDESARKAGITHLLEHLVMSQVGTVSLNHNATTNDVALSFYAQGPAHLVADYLNRVAASIRAIDDITDDAVRAEGSHIAAELGDGNDTTGTGPLLERYGAATLGLLDLGFPAHRSLTRADAVAWARTWLHSGNAVLTFSGPMPQQLDVTLPPAAPLPERPVITPLPHRVHGWVGGGRVPVALSFDLTNPNRDIKFVTGLAIEKALFEELRTARHLVYSVEGHVGLRSHDTSAVTQVLDPQPENILATAEAALAVLRGLATQGPSQDLLDRVVEEWRNSEEDSDVLYSALLGSAARWVRDGVEPLGIDHRPMATVTPEQVRQTVARSLDTLLVSFGDFETDMTPEAMSDRLQLPWARTPKGHYESMGGKEMFKALMRSESDIFDAKRFGGQRGQQIVLDPERLSWIIPDYGVTECRWDGIVLAGRCGTCGLWDITDTSGDGMLLQPTKWRGGDKIAPKLVARLNPESVYPIEHAAWH